MKASEAEGREPAREGRVTVTTRSRVGQIKTSLDAFDADVHPIKPIRHIGVLILETPHTLLDFPDIVAHAVDCATNMAQMLKNNVVGLNHGARLS
jgi:hypothetical protein